MAKRKQKTETKEPRVFSLPGATTKQTLAAALEQWDLVPWDTLAYHDDRTVVFVNGIECLYVQLPTSVTPRAVAEAADHFYTTGKMVRLDD